MILKNPKLHLNTVLCKDENKVLELMVTVHSGIPYFVRLTCGSPGDTAPHCIPASPTQAADISSGTPSQGQARAADATSSISGSSLLMFLQA